MKTKRTKLFETNSSSCNTLSIINLELYNKWKNNEVAIRFVAEDKYEDRKGDPETGYMSTWGNFSAYQEYPESIPSTEKVPTNTKILKTLCENGGFNWSSEKDSIYSDILEYEITGVFSERLKRYISTCNVYLSQEEYKEFLKYDDCESPYLYFGDGIAVLGHYYHS